MIPLNQVTSAYVTSRTITYTVQQNPCNISTTQKYVILMGFSSFILHIVFASYFVYLGSTKDCFNCFSFSLLSQ